MLTKPPAHSENSFDCPFCGVFASQSWNQMNLGGFQPSNYKSSRCAHCGLHALWIDKRLVYPMILAAPPPSSDMPAGVSAIYLEASAVHALSPRAAAALLRLALQMLCVDLGQPGKNINDDIGALVEAGRINKKLQQAMDLVRVVGNNAVHPGQIDFSDGDSIEVCSTLFDLLNMIVEDAISRPNKIEVLYNKHVPANLKTAIDNRDKK